MQTSIPDDDTANGVRDVMKPSFEHKVSSVMQVKDEQSGKLTGDWELAWSDERGDYVMRPLGDEQVDMFDGEEEAPGRKRRKAAPNGDARLIAPPDDTPRHSIA